MFLFIISYKLLKNERPANAQRNVETKMVATHAEGNSRLWAYSQSKLLFIL